MPPPPSPSQRPAPRQHARAPRRHADIRDAPAPTRSRLSSVNLRRAFDGEDWRAYNRLSLWIKPEVRDFPMLPLQIVLHNYGAESVPAGYVREGIPTVTLANDK